MTRLLACLLCSLAIAVCPATADPGGPVLEFAGYTCVVPPGIPCPHTNWEVVVTFDEDIDPVTAGDESNYTFHPVDDPDAVIPVAEVAGIWDDEVYLILTALPADEDHLLNVVGVEDLEGNPVVPQSWVVVPLVFPDGVPDLAVAQLLPAAPNPFNPTTEVSFVLTVAGPVELAAYDLAGRRVATLEAGSLAAGQYRRRWHAAGLPSGTYLLRLVAGGATSVQKVSLVR